MGNIQTMWDTGDDYQITPAMDGGTYQRFRDGICGGIGDEFNLTYSSNSLVVQFSAGNQCIIGGAFFRTMALEAITLAANSTIYLCANIDKTLANGSRGSFVQRTASNMKTDNLNSTGESRDLLLYIITTSQNGVTNVEDKRIVLGDQSSINGYSIVILSETDYEAIASPDANTIYYTFEDA